MLISFFLRAYKIINIFRIFFSREIQMATGEWIHDYLNRSGGGNTIKRNKSINNGQRLYVAAQGLQPPSSVDNKKNIKRSWTISSKKKFRLNTRLYTHSLKPLC